MNELGSILLKKSKNIENASESSENEPIKNIGFQTWTEIWHQYQDSQT